MAKKLNVPISKITSGEHTLRVKVDDEEIAALAASISRIGLVNPLSVVMLGDSFLVVAGHRRLAACRVAGLETVSCIVFSGGVAEVKEIAFAENLFRADLSAVEVAAGVADLYKSEVMGIREIAGALRRSEGWVESQIAMLDWPGDILEAIHARRISVSAARNLAAVTEESYRLFLLDQAVGNGATARITAAWLQAWRAGQMQAEAVATEAEPSRDGAPPAEPRAPCLICGTIARPDSLCSVLVCTACLGEIRRGAGGGT